VLSQTKDVTFHAVFSIYNKLFDHLEASIRQLQRKKVPWKKLMLSALLAAKDKLSSYYGETDNAYSDLFAIGTILAPQNKLQFFNDKDWGSDLREKYRQSFETYAEPYKERLSTTRSPPQASSSGAQTSKIDALFALDFNPSLVYGDELTQYLKSGK
jgi:hypothetical protein